MANLLDGFKNPWQPDNSGFNAMQNEALQAIQQMQETVLGNSALQTNVFDNNGEVFGDTSVDVEQDKDFYPNKLLCEIKDENLPYSGDDYEFHNDENYYPDIPEKNKLQTTVESFKDSWKNELNVATYENITDEFIFKKLENTLLTAGSITDCIRRQLKEETSGYNYDIKNNTITSGVKEIIRRLKQNYSGDFIMPRVIQDAAWNTNMMTKLIKDVEFKFIIEMQKLRGDYKKIISLNKGNNSDLTLPYFTFNKSNFALHAVIGGIQLVKVYLQRIQYFKKKEQAPASLNTNNKAYSYSIDIFCYDDFGINANDIYNPTSNIVKAYGLEALVAFWVLQNHRGYKPFTTQITKNVTGYAYY